MKILLVEDVPFMQEAMANVIESAGIQVMRTDNLEDAKKLLATENFKLLITDLYLPKPDGFALVDHVKNNKEFNSIPVIVVTGNRDTIANKVAADEWLNKPFTLDELINAIRKHLDGVTV